jgi:hypothetical protein
MSAVEAVVQMVQKEESPSEFNTKALSEPIRSIVGVGGRRMELQRNNSPRACMFREAFRTQSAKSG